MHASNGKGADVHTQSPHHHRLRVAPRGWWLPSIPNLLCKWQSVLLWSKKILMQRHARSASWNFAGGHRNEWGEMWLPQNHSLVTILSTITETTVEPRVIMPMVKSCICVCLPFLRVQFTVCTWALRAGHRGLGVERGWTVVMSKHQALPTGWVS